jgi:hypothetical protein
MFVVVAEHCLAPLFGRQAKIGKICGQPVHRSGKRETVER